MEKLIDPQTAKEILDVLGGAKGCAADLTPREQQILEWFVFPALDAEKVDCPAYELTDEEECLRVELILQGSDIDAEITTGEDGKYFVVVSSWRAIGEIQQEYNRRYCPDGYRQWYNDLVANASHNDHPFEDLRVEDDYSVWAGNHKRKPDNLWSLGDHYGFDDEWSLCYECGALVRTSPDSYGWQLDGELVDGEGYRCANCVREKPYEYIDAHVNQNKLLNKYLVDPLEVGWTELDADFEHGLHHGQNDDPRAVIKVLNAENIDCLFTGQPSQFYVEFTVWVRDADAERAQDILEDAIAARKTKLPYDPGDEFARALRGEKSEHVAVTSATLPGGGQYQNLALHD